MITLILLHYGPMQSNNYQYLINKKANGIKLDNMLFEICQKEWIFAITFCVKKLSLKL